MEKGYPQDFGTLPAPDPEYAARKKNFKWPSFKIFAVQTVIIHVIHVETNTVILSCAYQ